MNNGASFQFWVFLTDGEIQDEMYSIGILNGINACEIDDLTIEMIEEVKDSYDLKKDFPPKCVIYFTAENITSMEGQMSFPETSQWDFPPYIEMDVYVTYIEGYPGEGCEA